MDGAVVAAATDVQLVASMASFGIGWLIGYLSCKVSHRRGAADD